MLWVVPLNQRQAHQRGNQRRARFLQQIQHSLARLCQHRTAADHNQRPLRRSQSEALSPDSFRPLLDALRESYSYILIDTPPFSFFADAEELADAADAAILVVRQDLVPAAVVNDTIDDLNAAHAALLGCVLNNYQSFHFGSRLGGYGYGYGYGSYGGKYGYYGYGSKQGKEAAHGRTDDART